MSGNLLRDILQHADFEEFGGFTDGMTCTCDSCGAEILGEPNIEVDTVIGGVWLDVAELCDNCAPA